MVHYWSYTEPESPAKKFYPGLAKAGQCDPGSFPGKRRLRY